MKNFSSISLHSCRDERKSEIYMNIFICIYIDIYSSYLHFHSAALRTCCHNAEERRSVLYTPSLHSLGVSHGSFLCEFHIVSVLMGKGNDLRARVCVCLLCYAMLWRTLHVGFYQIILSVVFSSISLSLLSQSLHYIIIS